MAFDISYIFQAIDKFTRPARDILRSTKALQAGMSKLNAVAKFGAELQRKNMFVMAGMDMAIGLLGRTVLGTTAKFQNMHMAFTAMMDDPKKADWLFKQAKISSQKYGAATTLQFGKAYAGFVALGAQAKLIPGVVSRLADIGTQIGVPIDRMALGYGKVFGTGRITRREIPSLLYQTGIRNIFAKIMHTSLSNINKMLLQGKKKMPFAVLAKAIRIMTSKKGSIIPGIGGKFLHGQKAAGRTLSGAYRKVQDTLQVLTDNVGQYIATQYKLNKRAESIQQTMIKVNHSFAAYAKRFGWLIKVVLDGLLAFAALVTVNFLLGSIIRTVEIIVIGYSAVIKLATAATWLWNKALKRLLLFALWPFKAALLRVSEALYIAAMGGTAFDIAMALLPIIIVALVVGLALLLRHFKLLMPVLKGIGDFLYMTLIKPLEMVINLIKKAIPGFEKLEKVMKPLGAIEMPFAKLGHWIGSKIPVSHAMTASMAAPALSVATPHQDIVSALQQAFPNLNEGLKTLVNVHINGKETASTEHAGHVSGFPHFDVGVNMPLSGGV